MDKPEQYTHAVDGLDSRENKSLTEVCTGSTGAPSRLHPLMLPGWDLDSSMYQNICQYLGITASDVLYAKVASALQQRAPTRPSCVGFARWLAELKPGRLTLGFLDTWTRLLWPDHPWRQRLNAVLAVHECDARGYREMIAMPNNRARAWLELVGIGLSFAFNLSAGAAWLVAQLVIYALTRTRERHEVAYFAGRTVLVTGAARGLGLAIIARLLSLGARVVAVARGGSSFDALADQVADAGWTGQMQLLCADLSKPGSLDLIVDEPGRWVVDTVVLNAAVKEETLLPQGIDALRHTFEVNVFSAMATTSLLLSELLASSRGHIIFISSQGRWHGMARSGAYNASKAALSLLAESLLMDLGDEGRKRVRITTVEPGLLRTTMIRPGSLQDRLAMDVQSAAARILQAAARGRRIYRFPMGFTLLTTVMVLMPQSLRVRIFGNIKQS